MDSKLPPPTSFEKMLNQTILEYVARNLLVTCYFPCSDCGTLYFRPVPRDLEHIQCCCCGKFNDWESVESGQEFGGEA